MWPDYAEVSCSGIWRLTFRATLTLPGLRFQSIVDFRYRQLGAAKVNAAQYNLSGALYPWTGARFGNCTGVGPVRAFESSLHKLQTDALRFMQCYD